MHEALFWHREEADGDMRVVCDLCPRKCVLADGQVGACGVRQAKEGKLYAMSYGRPCALHVDPVEKKPLFHFHPGERIFSLATIGCNLFCDFCQNWDVSKARLDALGEEEEVPPERVVAFAREAGCRLIAFTYTEPTVYYEYMLAIATLAKQAGLECAIVSNGYIEEEPLKRLIPFLAAANIDLKGTAAFYRKRCKVPDYAQVKRTIVALKQAGIHVEITNLMIPGENDTDGEVAAFAEWTAKEVGRETPVHFTAFHPDYKMLDTPTTTAKTLLKAREIARQHLDFVYVGNVPGEENDTRCPGCGTVVIERPIYAGKSRLTDGKCPRCGQRISGRFSGKKG